jgi:hypothetical protein
MARRPTDIHNSPPQSRPADTFNSPQKSEDYLLFQEWLEFCEVDGLERFWQH